MSLRRPLLTALIALAAAIPAAGGAGAQTTQGVQSLQIAPDDADRQVQAVMYHRLMAEVIRTGIREQIASGGSAVGDVNPYPSVTSGKALAVCVNWEKSTLDRVTWGGFAYRYGATVTPRESEELKSRTLADCQAAYAGRDCACQLLDVDGQNVLEVPSRFLAEYGRF